MSTPEILYAGLLLALVVAYVDALRSISKMKRRMDVQQERLSQYWREHKDDHYECIRKHERLVTVLGFKEVRAVPETYAKEDK